MARSFTADLEKFADLTADKLDRVFKQSVQDVMEAAQKPVAQGGNMPVDTGFLRNSVASDLNGTRLAQGGDSYTVAIAQMEAGDTATFAWTADYAVHVEYGARGRPGRMFVGQAAAQWQPIVEANARRVR